MSIRSKLSQIREEQNKEVQSRVEEYVTFIRVYYQSVMAVNLGITNINMIPDVAVFKRMLKIQTQGGRLGTAEKSRSQKILMQEYGLNERFFSEIDASIKKNCKKQTDLQSYLYLFQGFSNDLMMVVGKQMQWKLAIPGLLKKLIYSFTKKAIHNIINKKDWKSDEMIKPCKEIQKYQEKLGYSEEWMTQYVFPILLMAKKKK